MKEVKYRVGNIVKMGSWECFRYGKILKIWERVDSYGETILFSKIKVYNCKDNGCTYKPCGYTTNYRVSHISRKIKKDEINDILIGEL